MDQNRKKLFEIKTLISDYKASGRDYPISVERLFLLLEQKLTESFPPLNEVIDKKELLKYNIVLHTSATYSDSFCKIGFVITIPNEDGSIKYVVDSKYEPTSVSYIHASLLAILQALYRLGIETKMIAPIAVITDNYFLGEIVVDQSKDFSLDKEKEAWLLINKLAAKTGVQTIFNCIDVNSTSEMITARKITFE